MRNKWDILHKLGWETKGTYKKSTCIAASALFSIEVGPTGLEPVTP